MYNISEREDGSFEVRKEGSKRATKIFNSKIEAIKYCQDKGYNYNFVINAGNKNYKVNHHYAKKIFISLLIVVLLVVVIFGVLYALEYNKVINIGIVNYFNNIFIHNKDNTNSNNENNNTIEGTIYDDFEIHFLELGNDYTGDSIYIKAGDTDILIDAGSRKDSAVVISNYLDKYVTDNKLEYVIATHGDQDHIAGFVGNKSNGSYTGILYNYQIDNIIMNERTSKATQVYKDFLTAVDYAVSEDAKLMYAADCFNNVNGASSSFILDENNNITLDILYNYYYFNDSDDENNYSVCTMFNYNEHHFMLTGDLEIEGEEYLAAYYDASTPKRTLPHVDLFKAGHHGSRTSSNECLLELITPSIVTVCCCAGSTEYTNNYQTIFPTQEFIDRVAKYTDSVYVTSYFDEKELKTKPLNGTIIVSCDGTNTAVSASNNITKLKDSSWFNETVHVKDGKYISSGKGKNDFYTIDTIGVEAKKRRIWPEY